MTVSVTATPTETRPLPRATADADVALAATMPVRSTRTRPDLWGTLLVALVLCLVTFVASGGLTLATATEVEIGLTLVGGVVIATVVVLLRDRGQWRAHGLWAAIGMLVLTAFTALSVAWSVSPDASWQEANLILAYTVTFIAAAVVARAVPARAASVLGGIVLAAIVVCGYALATKVFPAQLDQSDVYARLQAPYAYWNAIGLTAAMGIVGFVWLGARRDGPPALAALAYPATGLCVVTMMLAYSRGALLALAIGLALWFATVPLRLRGASVAVLGGGGGLVVTAWAFRSAALSDDRTPLVERVSAGHQLGVLLLALVLVLLAAGLAIGYATGRRAPSARIRRRAGALLLGALALVPVLVVLALAASHRGLTGTISHDYHTLTNLNPSVSNGPGRLTAVGSVRALYWDEALKVWKAHPAVGVGAGGYQTARLHFAHDSLDVRDAHGYVVQTLADLGLVGLGISLALLVAWLAAAARSARPFDLRWVRDGRRARWSAWRLRRVRAPYPPERIALLTMLSIVVVFGAHSTIDWTWFVPGDACVALLCAGWLAGRGPVETRPAATVIAVGDARDPSGRRARALGALGLPAAVRLRRPVDIGVVRVFAAIAVLAIAAIGAWAQWQPQSSVDADNAAFVALATRDQAQALSDAQRAVQRDPLSVEALVDLAQVQLNGGDVAGAHVTLNHAVTVQPANPAGVARARLPRGDGDERPAVGDRRPAPGDLPRPDVDAGGERVRVRPAPGAGGGRAHRRPDRRHATGTGRPATPLAWLEARSARARQQRPPRPGHPAEPREADVLEAKVRQQRGERAPRVEAQVIRAWIEAAVERARGESEDQARQRPVVGRAEQQRSARSQHAAHLGHPPGRVGDVLDDLARPHHVELGVGERPRGALGLDEPQVEARVALGGPA